MYGWLEHGRQRRVFQRHDRRAQVHRLWIQRGNAVNYGEFNFASENDYRRFQAHGRPRRPQPQWLADPGRQRRLHRRLDGSKVINGVQIGDLSRFEARRSQLRRHHQYLRPGRDARRAVGRGHGRYHRRRSVGRRCRSRPRGPVAVSTVAMPRLETSAPAILAIRNCKLQNENCKLQIADEWSSICNLHFAICNLQSSSSARDEETVGHSGAGRTVTPVNQVLTPLGRQVDLPGMRPQALALSPDGALLVVSGKTSELVVLDPQKMARFDSASSCRATSSSCRPSPVSATILKPDREGQLSFTGLIFSPRRRPHLHEQRGRLDQGLRGGEDGTVSASHSLPLAAGQRPAAKAGNPQRPGDLRRWQALVRLRQSFESLAGARCGERQDTADVRCRRRAVRCRARRTESVRQQLGRPPAWPDDLTGPAGRGTTVRVDPARHRQRRLGERRRSGQRRDDARSF